MAVVFGLTLAIGLVGRTDVNVETATAAGTDCTVSAEVAEGIGGTRMYDPHAGVTKKFVKKDGKAYIRVVVTGAGCSQNVSLVAWKTSSISGQPYRDQVMLESKSATVVTGDSKTMNVTIPDCYFQIDLVRGGPNGSSQGGGSYGDRMIHSVHGGNKTCFPVEPPPPPPPPPPAPTYSCDLLNLRTDSGKKVYVTEFKTSAANGAAYTKAVINWGDGQTSTVTNNAVGTEHTFASDGTYTVAATAYFTVNGSQVTATSPGCTKIVTFKPAPPPDELIVVCELATNKIIIINESQFDPAKHSRDLSRCAVIPPTPEQMIVCELATKKIIIINKPDYDATKHSTDLSKCAPTPPTPEQLVVCELATKKIIVIKKEDYDETEHATDLTRCLTVVPPTEDQMVVCELSTKNIVIINKDTYDESKYTTDQSKCAVSPTTVTAASTPPQAVPEALPDTGMGAVIGLFASFTAAGMLAHRFVWTRHSA